MKLRRYPPDRLPRRGDAFGRLGGQHAHSPCIL
jgi:hypothetical protein